MLLGLYLIAILHIRTGFCEKSIFSVIPQSQDVYAGRNAVFQCSLKETYIYLYTLTWRCDGIPMKVDSRRYVGSDGYLHFDPVDKELDSAEFECVATSKRPPYEEHATRRVWLNIKWLDVHNVILRSSCDGCDILPGKRVMLKCNATGSPKPQIKSTFWRFNGTLISNYHLEFNISKGRLVIEQAELKIYDGLYSCCLPEDNREKCSKYPFALHVRDQSIPVVINKPEDITVQLGYNATFTCGFESFPPPRIEWLYDGDPIRQRPAQNCRVCSFNNGTLVIRNVKDRHEGSYTCQAIGNGRTVSVSADLTIAYIKNFSNPKTEVKYLDRGQDLEKVCNPPDAEPHPSISWVRDGQAISPSTGGMTSRITVSGKTLVILSVRHTDEGEYQCVAKNMAGIVTKTYQFKIKKKPEIISKLVGRTEREGSDVTLNCLAAGVPSPEFKWHQNNTLLKSNDHFLMTGNQFTIKSISVKDTAEYTCTAKNVVGTASSSAFIRVKEWLKFDWMPDELCVEANKTTSIMCVARGAKNPVVEWTLSPDSSQSVSIISNGPGNKTLMLLNPSLGESWTAHCTAKTEGSLVDLPTPTHTIKVSVGKRPRIVKPPENSVVFKGQSVRLDCGIEPNPSNLEQLHWRVVTNNSVMEYSLKTNSDSNKYTVMNDGSFFINNVSTADSGNYSCHYKDCGFESNKQALLDVAETEGPITVPTDSVDGGHRDGEPQYQKVQTIALAAGCSVAYLILTLTIIVYCRRKKKHKDKASSSKNCENAENSLLMHGGFISPDCRVAEDEMLLKPLSHMGEEIQHLWYDQSKLDHVTVIGRGEYGEVCLSRAPNIFPHLQDDVLVMVKKFDLNSFDQNNITTKQRQCLKHLRNEFKREIRILYKSGHNNVGKILGVCGDSTDYALNPTCFITEYLEWGILKLCLQASSKGKLQRFGKIVKMRMCYQIAAGLEHLTSIRISHQDVATRNCLISSKLCIKLSVLSLKKEGFENEYTLHNGRLMPVRWMAPETLDGGPFELKSDVWSFGVTCWEIFTLGTMPFSDLSDDQFLEEMNKEHPPTLPAVNASKRVTSLISKCCQKSMTLRPEFYQIVKKLRSILGMEPRRASLTPESNVEADIHSANSFGDFGSCRETLDVDIVP